MSLSRGITPLLGNVLRDYVPTAGSWIGAKGYVALLRGQLNNLQ
jgi:hypothetical protein